MTGLGALLRDPRGAGAAEFALVLPLMLLFLLGIIDAGRFIWNVNEAEKASQTGVRWAVATDMIPTDLYNYSFAVSGGIAQGTVVPQTDFPGVSCTSTNGTVSCACATGGTCNFGLTANQTAFDALVARMQDVYPGIAADNVRIDYDWSGLGYSGDPNGSDVDPIVTVRLTNLTFRPIFLGTIYNAGLPDQRYSLTMEDGEGSFSN